MKAAHTIESSTGLNKKTGLILVLLGFVLIAMVIGYFLVNQVQNPAKRADEGEGTSLTGPSCPVNGFICRWNREPGVTYHYTIRDNQGTLVKEGDIPASSGTDKIIVTHTPDAGKTYTCIVAATNECGIVSDEKSIACTSSPQPTLIESPIPSITIALSITPSTTPTGTISPTLSPTPSPTLPPNVTPSKTPTPTDIVIVNVTNTPQPTQQNQPTTKPKSIANNPTLPTSGGLPSVSMLVIILAGFVVITFGLLL